ncbi:hypothetical protein [Flavobacterium sp. JP2137]|uniref:hypothetical protein n=1 Tax=Flavobacterium sp. JP2137 TaxID=3414510 RepID=UPI003D2FA437
MIYYLGDKVSVIDEKTRLLKNKNKSWEYGYNEVLDTVIISKDGTLGEVYCISGINIGLPQQPDKKEIINYDKTTKNQKWEREEIPNGLTSENWDSKKFEQYIDRQFKWRNEGIWIYLNGKPVYLTGTYWHFLQWFREGAKYPSLRIIQSELMIFWEACKADNRCYGMQYVKNRRFGASALGNNDILNMGSIHEDKILGMISKKGTDAKKIFNRLVRAFKRYPPFFKPETDGTNTPKTELVFTEQTKKRKQGEAVEEGQGLDTSISWHNTEINAMDGEEIFMSLIDEAGKYPKEVPFDEYWEIVKTSHRLGSEIAGKAFVVSTVNAMKKGGAGFKSVWDDGDPLKRNNNGETISGLYRIFIAAKYCIQGYFDEYGFSVVDDPEEPFINDKGRKVSIGAVTYLKNELDGKKDPQKQYEFLRQFPNSERDAFRDEANDCAFNLVHLSEQIEHNDEELENNERGNNEVERGNFYWKDGIQDTEVLWMPDPVNGRFWIAKDYHPPAEYRNKREKKMIHGVLAWAPVNGNMGCLGVDPYNRSKTVDNRGSMGSIHLATRFHIGPFPNDAFILEYIDRPKKVELFFEDVIMASVYFSMPFLPELSNEKFLQYVKDRGYRHFVLNNPFKLWKDLSDTEQEYGGVPPQDAKIGEYQFYAVEAYIQDHIGVARDESKRTIGEMGYMPFTRTLIQWKDVDPTKRTKYDAYISSSLALLGNQRRIKIEVEEPKPITIPFKRYDNSGAISKAM